MLSKSKCCLFAIAASGVLAGCGSKSVPPAVSGALNDLKIELEFDKEEELTIVRVNSDEEIILRYGDRKNNDVDRGLVTTYVRERISGSNAYGNFLTSKVEVGENLQANLYSFQDDSFTRRYIEFITLKDGNVLLEVRGDKPTNMPSGLVNYVGTNIMEVNGDRTKNEWGSRRESGTFKMVVDFENKSGNFVGDTKRRNASGDDDGLDASRIAGKFGVDVEAGTFFGDEDVVVTNASSLIEYPAVIYGNFHGDGASGVSGLYVEMRKIKESYKAPRFYGAISGLLGDQSTTHKEVRKFDNYYNVVREMANGERMLRYGYNESNQLRRRIVIDNRVVSPDGSNEHGNFHKGRVYIGLEGEGKLNRFVHRGSQELYVDYVSGLNENRIFIEVGGKSEFTIPKGQQKYIGTNVFTVRGNRPDNYWGSEQANGTFTMDVDFEKGNATITADTLGRVAQGGDTGLDSMTMSGNVSLNINDGTFSGNKMIVTNTKVDETFNAVINGSFHGDGASGVTGLYVEHNNDPRFFGAIVGVHDNTDRESN